HLSINSIDENGILYHLISYKENIFRYYLYCTRGLHRDAILYTKSENVQDHQKLGKEYFSCRPSFKYSNYKHVDASA
ncbi:hypothetical protein VIGAN_01294900, partial [Vigna angularis var. angularis]